MCKRLLSIIGMTGLLVVCYANSGQSFLYHPFHLATEKMERVAIFYDRVFSYPGAYQSRYIKGCTQLNSVVQKIISISVMQCRSYIYLLRPSRLVRYWQRTEALKGYFPLTVQEFGIIGVHGHVKAVKPAPESFNMYHANNKTFSVVSGVFLTWAPVIKRYLFKDLQTGLTAGVNATPNHRFYVKNKHAFIAIDTVSSADELITSSGHKVKLLCSPGRQSRCGDPVNSSMPAMVYNLEVNRSHRYFVAGSEILVHNGCESGCVCKWCDTRGFPIYLLNQDGSERYFGQIQNGVPHGFGTEFHPNGKAKYTGAWQMGLPHGFGTSFRENGTTEYEGDWVFGEKFGRGRFFFSNGNLGYEGEVCRGMYHGKGTAYYEESGEMEFKGRWEFNLMREGVCYLPDRTIYAAGEWKRNQFFKGVGHNRITRRLHYVKNGVAVDPPRFHRLEVDPIRREPREPQS